MISEERHQARFQRRRAARAAAKDARLATADNYEQVFSYGNLYQAYRKSRRNVVWKASVQRYITQAPLNVYRTWERLQAGTYASPPFFEFDIYERGKRRHIKSTIITDRVVQRCLCDNALVPMLSRTFIYDNGASLANKGYSFAIRRLTQHLREHYRKYGQSGYVLIFDFTKFFDNVSHELVKRILQRQFSDQRMLQLIQQFIDVFGNIGLGLGSQVSQVLALASANRLDHYIKEILRIRGYGRYMDDGYLIHHSKEYLQQCLRAISNLCKTLEIKLNLRKTQIVKLSHGFTWLKVRFHLTESGKVIRKIYKRSVTKMRQKLKKLRRRLNAEKITFGDVFAAWQSWKSYASNFNAYHTIQNMKALFDQLFITNMEGYNGLY